MTETFLRDSHTFDGPCLLQVVLVVLELVELVVPVLVELVVLELVHTSRTSKRIYEVDPSTSKRREMTFCDPQPAGSQAAADPFNPNFLALCPRKQICHAGFGHILLLLLLLLLLCQGST